MVPLTIAQDVLPALCSFSDLSYLPEVTCPTHIRLTHIQRDFWLSGSFL